MRKICLDCRTIWLNQRSFEKNPCNCFVPMPRDISGKYDILDQFVLNEQENSANNRGGLGEQPKE